MKIKKILLSMLVGLMYLGVTVGNGIYAQPVPEPEDGCIDVTLTMQNSFLSTDPIVLDIELENTCAQDFYVRLGFQAQKFYNNLTFRNPNGQDIKVNLANIDPLTPPPAPQNEPVELMAGTASGSPPVWSGNSITYSFDAVTPAQAHYDLAMPNGQLLSGTWKVIGTIPLSIYDGGAIIGTDSEGNPLADTSSKSFEGDVSSADLMDPTTWREVQVAADPQNVDANGDGIVDIFDVTIVSSCIGQDPMSNPACGAADVDSDGDVDIDDLNLVIAAFGQTFP